MTFPATKTFNSNQSKRNHLSLKRSIRMRRLHLSSTSLVPRKSRRRMILTCWRSFRAWRSRSIWTLMCRLWCSYARSRRNMLSILAICRRLIRTWRGGVELYLLTGWGIFVMNSACRETYIDDNTDIPHCSSYSRQFPIEVTKHSKVHPTGNRRHLSLHSL